MLEETEIYNFIAATGEAQSKQRGHLGVLDREYRV
jgi:hypothetical protein